MSSGGAAGSDLFAGLSLSNSSLTSSPVRNSSIAVKNSSRNSNEDDATTTTVPPGAPSLMMTGTATTPTKTPPDHQVHSPVIKRQSPQQQNPAAAAAANGGVISPSAAISSPTEQQRRAVRSAPVTDKLLNILGDGGVIGNEATIGISTATNAISSSSSSSINNNSSSNNGLSSSPSSPVPVAASIIPIPPTAPSMAGQGLSPKFTPAAKKSAANTKKRISKVALGTQKSEKVSIVTTAETTAVTTTTTMTANTNKTTVSAISQQDVKFDKRSAAAAAADINNGGATELTNKNSTSNEQNSNSKSKSNSTSQKEVDNSSSTATTPEPPPPRRRSSERPPPLDDENNTDDFLKRSSLRGVGIVKNDTPIPNSDIALKIFRKFAQKTECHVPESHGGTQALSLWTRYVSGTPTEYNTRFDAYREFMKSIAVEDAADEKDNNETSTTMTTTTTNNGTDAVVDSVLGESGDTMAKAREAMASFCHLMSVWGHASSHMAEKLEKKGSAYETFCGMVSIGYDTSTSLVTHGCLDGVMIGIGPNRDEYHKAADVLAESVFSGDLSQSSNELAAMKFLLSTGCRVTQGPDGEAMLRGSHLLQTIRVLYHAFLSTSTEANKTTARASLQQLVTSVFIRMIVSSSSIAERNHDMDDGIDNDKEIDSNQDGATTPSNATDPEGGPVFPSENHRDAFLVLRSLCKLSMRVQPSGERHSHVGLQTSGSNAMWDSSKDPTGRSPMKSTKAGHDIYGGEQNKEGLQHIYTHAIHPALESKILALDLLLYLLKRTDMSGSFLQGCGPQFHYAIRNYLCVSLLKNCTSDDTRVVNLSLRVFVPIFQNFRSILKTEIEAFVTNVFFVILDSKNSPIEHKSLVVTLFDEICSDPTTLAEIFLNYDCDLSAVDLFHRIINTLSKVARTTDSDNPDSNSTMSLISGSGGARMERIRTEHRELRLNAMRALRQVLASLNASIVEPMQIRSSSEEKGNNKYDIERTENLSKPSKIDENGHNDGEGKKSLVQIYDSKKKRREEDSEIVLRFNQKPKAGISYAVKCGHIDGSDPTDVARFLLKNKDRFEKAQIGEYLGREPEYEKGFILKVLHEYVNLMDFDGLAFDTAIRYYLSGFRLPGEAQKIDRILEKFAERYSEQNPDAFPSADVAFILSFSIIMLNTDLHNPSIKEERKMTKEGFIRNNRGISDGQDLPEEMLLDIFDRIKENQISLKEDDDARERVNDGTSSKANNALSPAVFFTNHYDEMQKTKESNFVKERDQIVRTTESLLKRRRHATLDSGRSGHRRSRSSNLANKSSHLRYVRTEDSGLRDEYVAPMFEVTWGPALAAFSTAMESANGTIGSLLAIATDEELEAAAINAAETIEVCLTGFRFAICTAGLVGNDVARDSYMFALSRFSQLGTGVLLEPRHVRCIQTMLVLARSDGELLGSSWEHIFRALSEINRFHQLFQLMARNDRVVAAAAERRKSRLIAGEKRREEKERRRVEKEKSDTIDDESMDSSDDSSDTDSYDGSSLFNDSDDFNFNDEMDTKEIDEANARTVYQAVAEDIVEATYERSSSMSTEAVKEFILQLCRVSRMEISHYGGFVASDSNEVNLTSVQYRKRHELLGQTTINEKEGFHHQQTNIYNLQKLVEVTHYNMDSRPRMVFADIWTTVSAHLTSTALHSNPAVAMYAVDAFRQLYTQYLQREELGVFEFQRRFLKPLDTVMARSEISTTKELLLRCVERIILMFGSPREGKRGGMLRSGWRPVLKVLGLAGRDSDEEIAKLGCGMLNAQIQECLDQCTEDGEFEAGQGNLLVERFVDLVDAVLIYVGGPHEEMSLKSIDDLLKLCDFLADESTASPLLKKRRSVASCNGEDSADVNEVATNEELELWWPILLGLSRSIGDSRKKVRRKSLESLMKIVSSHFFPSDERQESLDDEAKSKHIQTLQLVFRGIFSSVLEFGDGDATDAKTPLLPSDFERFLAAKKPGDPQKSDDAPQDPSWVDTTFDPFMDDCIHICLRSMKVFGDNTLIEEILAMLNSCLISDSGALAVKGLRRLELFVSSDLRTSSIKDDTWATISHMLRRCLCVRGLPRRSSSVSLNGNFIAAASASEKSVTDESKSKDKNDDEETPNLEFEEKEMIREFVAEDSMFFDRRYIGSNTISVIGKFLEAEHFTKSLSLRWRIFLVSGVGRGIIDWEIADGISARNSGKIDNPRRPGSPSYLETAYYGRKWMNRFLLQMATMKEIAGTAAEGSKQAALQEVVKEQTQALVSAFLEKEAVVAGDGKNLSLDVKSFDRLMNLVQDMLAGYAKLPDERLSLMSWLNPVLSSCIHTGNEDIRLNIQKLVKRLH
jgi:hypothetical protein